MKICFLLLPLVLLSLFACKKNSASDDYVYIPNFYCELDGVPNVYADTVSIYNLNDSIRINFSTLPGDIGVLFPASAMSGEHATTSEGPCMITFRPEASQQPYVSKNGSLTILFNGMEDEYRKVEAFFNCTLVSGNPSDTIILSNGKISQFFYE